MSESLLVVTHLLELRRAFHEIAYNHHTLHCELPVLILLLACLAFSLAVECCHRCAGELLAVLVIVMALVRLAVFLNPCHSLLELLLVIDSEIDTAQNLDERRIFSPHAKIVLQEVCVDDRARYAHTRVAKGEIRLAAHCGDSLCCTGESQYLLRCVLRYAVVCDILDIMSVDAICWETFLGMCGENCCEIHRSGTLCAVESPYCLGVGGVHIHRL